ncbi:MAG: phosphoglycerate kinase [Chloroflexi bacterium]|nr:phosphoglycerate kinase [Chloroflexota bacterium]
MTAKLSVADIPVEGKRALVRVDFNVPLDKEGRITNDARIRATLPTIRYLLEHRAKVILISHLGRPGGKPVEGLRMAPIGARLTQLLGQPVRCLSDCVGPFVAAECAQMAEGEVILLENVRFHPGDEANDSEFARQLANLADLFVNDAFGAAHRAHASTVGVAIYLPAVAGLLMQRELEMLGNALEEPDRPFVAIVGGAKISDKLPVLSRLLPKVDRVLVGGGVACTFLKALGYEIGQSLVEMDRIHTAYEVLSQGGHKIILPTDVIVTDKLDPNSVATTVDVAYVPADRLIADIGPQSIASFREAIANARTVLWTGPLGVFEIPNFATGTREIAQALTKIVGKTIIGGGDLGAALEQFGYADKMTHLSTGGGASLEFLGGSVLPGVAVLSDRAS